MYALTEALNLPLREGEKYIYLPEDFNMVIHKIDTNSYYKKYQQDILIYMVTYFENNFTCYNIDSEDEALDIIL